MTASHRMTGKSRQRERIGGRGRYLRSGTSLAALTLKAANPFLMPLLPHLRVGIRKCFGVDEVKMRGREEVCRFKRTKWIRLKYLRACPRVSGQHDWWVLLSHFSSLSRKR